MGPTTFEGGFVEVCSEKSDSKGKDINFFPGNATEIRQILRGRLLLAAVCVLLRVDLLANLKQFRSHIELAASGPELKKQSRLAVFVAECEAEVKKLGIAVVCYANVFRLDIEMSDLECCVCVEES